MAQEIIKSHGYSFFGELKYPADFEHFTQLRGEAHKRFPQTLNPVDWRIAGFFTNGREHRVAVCQRRHANIVRQAALHRSGQRRHMVLAQPGDPRSAMREPAAEVGHLSGIAWGYEQDVDSCLLSSERI